MPPRAASSKSPKAKAEKEDLIQGMKKEDVHVDTKKEEVTTTRKGKKKETSDLVKNEDVSGDNKFKGDTDDNAAEGTSECTTATNDTSKEKIPLQKWLKEFTTRGVDMRVAMALASKLYPTNPALADIIKMTGPKLQAAGVVDKEHKRSVMSAVRSIQLSLKVVHGTTPQDNKPAKKRKRDMHEGNPLLPGDPSLQVGRENAARYKFNETHDIEVLRTVTVKTNRAPCMTAWAYIILEKMGFDRLEALSLASVFTSITSTQHALNLGNIYDDSQTKDAKLELSQLPGQDRKRRRVNGEPEEEEETGGNAQPWVGLMRRRLPVIQLNNGTWRGLSKGMAVEPNKAHSYISRAFGEATGSVIGALRLLAQCYTLEDLQDKGYGIYVSFRPEVQGWGDKALLYCANIIDMIPPENEVDLLMHGNVVPQSLETKEQLIHSKLEEPDEEDLVQVKKELEFDVIGMKGDAGGFEKTREDVFEGFWEAEYDDEY